MNIKPYLFLPLYIIIALISNLLAIYSVSAQVITDGTGGIPQPPAAIFDSEIIAIGQINEEPAAEEVKPILTSQGEITPARGVVVKENGDIVLTAYKTDNNSRVQTVNCNPT